MMAKMRRQGRRKKTLSNIYERRGVLMDNLNHSEQRMFLGHVEVLDEAKLASM